MKDSVLKYRDAADILFLHEIPHPASQRRERVIAEIESVVPVNTFQKKA